MTGPQAQELASQRQLALLRLADEATSQPRYARQTADPARPGFGLTRASRFAHEAAKSRATGLNEEP